MTSKTDVSHLEGPYLAMYVARVSGLEEKAGAVLYAAGPTLYKESGHGGGIPFDYRPDTNPIDLGLLIWEMTKDGSRLDLAVTGCTLVPPTGDSLYAAGRHLCDGLCRCYLLWKAPDLFCSSVGTA